MYDSIIFDLDGTLWDSTEVVAEAFNKVLKDYPKVTDEVNADILRSLFGRPIDEIGVKLFKSLPSDEAKELINICCEYENEYLTKVNVATYEGVYETVKELSKKYKLFIVSNCQEGYIQCFFTVHPELEEHFIDFEYPGRTGKSKADNIKMIIERNNLTDPIYVGDTLGDAKASKEAGIPFIFAKYGFGDVKDFNHEIESINEILTKLKF